MNRNHISVIPPGSGREEEFKDYGNIWAAKGLLIWDLPQKEGYPSKGVSTTEFAASDNWSKLSKNGSTSQKIAGWIK